MKYLLVLSWMGQGGSERQAINLAEHLIECGNNVTVLGLDNPGKINDICSERNIKCISFPPKNTIYSIAYKMLHILGIRPLTNEEIALLGLIRDLSVFIRKNNYDICISYCTTANIVLGMAKKRYSKITAIWYQGDAGIYDKCDGLQPEAIQYFDGIISNGITAYNWIKNAYGKESRIIHNGVKEVPPLKSRSEWRSEIGLTESDIICTMVANLTSAKDHMFLLKVWNELKDCPLPFKLCFAGVFGDKYDDLKNYVEYHQLNDVVFFLGYVSDIFGLLHASDICVFGAISEGSPNGIVEGCLSRLPVMATNLPEIREVISEENHRYLFDNGNSTQAVSNLIELGESITIRHKLGEKNREHALQFFNPAQNMNARMKYCEELYSKNHYI